MRFVGLAASAGVPIDIPIITRTLSFTDLGGYGNDTHPHFPWSAVLDGSSHPTQEFGIVLHYHLDWWNHPECPQQILDDDMLTQCLEVHHGVLDHPPGSETVAGPFAGHSLADYPSIPPPHISLNSQAAAGYCAMALDTSHQLQAVANRLHAQETASANALHLAIRRASGFNMLYEHAMTLESMEPTRGHIAGPPSQPSASIGNRAGSPAATPQPSSSQPMCKSTTAQMQWKGRPKGKKVIL